jgi:hypothetical protein
MKSSGLENVRWKPVRQSDLTYPLTPRFRDREAKNADCSEVDEGQRLAASSSERLVILGNPVRAVARREGVGEGGTGGR